MKKLLLTILIAISVFALYAQTTESQKGILELEKQRTDAIAAHDAAFLSNLYDDAYAGVGASGALVHKAEQLDVFKTRNSFVMYSTEDIVTTVYGSIAVLTGKQITKSKSGSVLGQTRYLLVYSNLSGQWKIVTGQETDVIKN